MEIKKITIVGAGVMGRGIAHVAALGGYDTVMQDMSTDILDASLSAIKRNLQKGIKKGKITDQDMKAALSRLKTETDLSQSVQETDLVIEAIPEDTSLKLEMFSQLDRLCKEETVFASNTSALSITEMAVAAQRTHKLVGMHFFNPPHIMKLVEIIRGLETDEETVKVVDTVAWKMGKETVEINESPGFVTSRINALIGNEAFYMLQENVASARDIDKALKLGLNHPMGPFELGDMVGLDVRLSVLNFLYQRLGEKYRPCPLLIKYVKAGRLGRKTGKGVYNYNT